MSREKRYMVLTLVFTFITIGNYAESFIDIAYEHYSKAVVAMILATLARRFAFYYGAKT